MIVDFFITVLSPTGYQFSNFMFVDIIEGCSSASTNDFIDAEGML